MGHERVGALPKTARWASVVRDLTKFGGDEDQSRQLANRSLDNVRARFESIQRDRGVQAAFRFLTQVSRFAGSGPEGIDSTSSSNIFAVAKALRAAVESETDSAEYAALASAAGSDAIGNWYADNSTQSSLFGTSDQASGVWQKAGTAGGFSEISRLFFAKFTERYLKYFLEREASGVCSSIAQRDQLQKQLRSNIDGVSRHAFETAKITQSFAAGWFNRHARGGAKPTDGEIRGFLAIAFGKIREDLRREPAG